MDPLPEVPQRNLITATGVDIADFHVTCSAGHQFVTSRWTQEDDLVRCNYPGCANEYRFRSGLYSQHQKVPTPR